MLLVYSFDILTKHFADLPFFLMSIFLKLVVSCRNCTWNANDLFLRLLCPCVVAQGTYLFLSMLLSAKDPVFWSLLLSVLWWNLRWQHWHVLVQMLQYAHQLFDYHRMQVRLLQEEIWQEGKTVLAGQKGRKEDEEGKKSKHSWPSTRLKKNKEVAMFILSLSFSS